MQSISRFLAQTFVTPVAALAMIITLLPNTAQSDPKRAEAAMSSFPPSSWTHHAALGQSMSLHQRAGYMAQETRFLGTIYHAMGEPFFLSADDMAMIDAGADADLHVGDRLTVFRFMSAVHNPRTNAFAGRPVRILGDAVVVRVNDTTAAIRITLEFGEIEVGDRVERFGVLPPSIRPADVPAQTAMTETARPSFGSILTSRDEKVALAEGDIVFIDQGARQGVQRGDHFVILEDAQNVHHPDTDARMPVPRQVIGKLTIVDVQAHTATAFVMESLREFAVGALVRPASWASTPAGRLAKLAHADALVALLTPCLEEARQAIRAAQAADVSSQDLAAAQSTRAVAAVTFEQAQDLLEQGKRKPALQLLEGVHSDCLKAQQLAHRLMANRYIVKQGDTLRGIAALPAIYRNPLLWPLLYQANRDHIDDPDLIYPRQVFTVPRTYSHTEAATAVHRARTRGPWRLGDGPDTYILKGVRP